MALLDFLAVFPEMILKPIEVLTIKPTWMEYADTLLCAKRKP